MSKNYLQDLFIDEVKGALNNSGGSGSGGANIQPDWNQNDPTAADYVKNRTHWSEISEGEILAETTIEITDGMGYIVTPFEITVGAEYTVGWNGASYTGVAQAVDYEGVACVTLGDVSLLTGGVSTGDPFGILYLSGAMASEGVHGVLVALDGSAYAVLTIDGTIETMYTIDEKFLPPKKLTNIEDGSSHSSARTILTRAEDDSYTMGIGAFAEGYDTTASGDYSHAEGYNTTAIGDCTHSEGRATTASGLYSHAEGYNTTASGLYSHAEGNLTTASGADSHAEGNVTTASGANSHAEGYNTTASGDYSHAEGNNTTAIGDCQHVQGSWNIDDAEGRYAHIVGNGGMNGRGNSNAHTLDWDGNAWFAGTVEGTALILASSTEGSTKRFKITVDDSGTLTAIEIA